MGTKIKWETAENMMNIVAFTACQSFIENGKEIDLEAIQDFARSTFEKYCKAMGITEVDEPEEVDAFGVPVDYDSDFDEDKDKEEDMESIIYDVDGHRGISSADARLLMQCVAKTISEKFSGLPEDILTVFIQTEIMRIANAYGIEVVDTSEDE